MLTDSQVILNLGSPTNSTDGEFMCEILRSVDSTHEASYGDGTGSE